jgi:hypothetical protein
VWCGSETNGTREKNECVVAACSLFHREELLDSVSSIQITRITNNAFEGKDLRQRHVARVGNGIIA